MSNLGDEEVEWEDVDDGWEVQCKEGGLADHSLDDAFSAGDDSLALATDTGPSRLRQVAVTKGQKLRAQAVHCSHTLCLMGRSLLFNVAASDSEVQAIMLSRLESPVLLRVHPELQPAINGLRNQLHWFRSTTILLPKGSEDTGNLDGTVPGIILQVRRGCTSLAAPAEAYVALFVALLRAMGVLARFVRLLDAAPVRPWLKRKLGAAAPEKPRASRKASTAITGAADLLVDAGSKAVSRKRGSSSALVTSAKPARKKKGAAQTNSDVEPDNDPTDPGSRTPALEPHLAATLDAALPMARGAYAQPLQQQQQQQQSVPRKFGRRSAKETLALAEAEASTAANSSSSSSSKVGKPATGATRSATLVTPGSKAQAADKGKATAGPATDPSEPTPAAATSAHSIKSIPASIPAGGEFKAPGDASASCVAADTPDPTELIRPTADAAAIQRLRDLTAPSGAGVRNKGMDEFELQMSMAMLATATDSQAKPLSGGAMKDGGMGTAVAPGRGVGGRGAGDAQGAAAKQLEGPALLKALKKQAGEIARGTVSGGKQGAECNVWAEVYCGSDDLGRWVHVDVLNGYIDRPDLVDTSTARANPLCYVLACGNQGEVRDVTERYVANRLSAQRDRMDEWWKSVAAGVASRAGGGCGSASSSLWGKLSTGAVAGSRPSKSASEVVDLSGTARAKRISGGDVMDLTGEEDLMQDGGHEHLRSTAPVSAEKSVNLHTNGVKLEGAAATTPVLAPSIASPAFAGSAAATEAASGSQQQQHHHHHHQQQQQQQQHQPPSASHMSSPPPVSKVSASADASHTTNTHSASLPDLQQHTQQQQTQHQQPSQPHPLSQPTLVSTPHPASHTQSPGKGPIKIDAGPSGSTNAAGARKVGRGKAQTGTAAVTQPASGMREMREEAELAQMARAQLHGLPTTIDGFKAHPIYVLRRHIKKYEALQPSTSMLGVHNGEPYYPRDAISMLHTTDRWRREGREVRHNELANPAKLGTKRVMPSEGGGGGDDGRIHGDGWGSGWAPRGGFGGRGGPGGRGGGGFGRAGSTWTRGGKPGAAGGGGRGPVAESGSSLSSGHVDNSTTQFTIPLDLGDADTQPSLEDQKPEVDPETLQKLYGRWQTDPWAPPPAQGGRVPKNERGNVECPPFASALPGGTVHLKHPGLGPLCRTLGIDFAVGLTGFEYTGGRMVPKIEGVVVCAEFKGVVMDAFREKEQAREIAAVAKWRREAQACWLTLIQALRVRTQLQADYVTGPNANGASTSATAAAAAKGKQPAKGRAAAAVAAATGAAAAAAAAAGKGPAAGGVASAAGAAAATAAAAGLASAAAAAADADAAGTSSSGLVGVAEGDTFEQEVDLQEQKKAGSGQPPNKRVRKSAVASVLQRLQLPQSSAVLADTAEDEVEDI